MMKVTVTGIQEVHAGFTAIARRVRPETRAEMMAAAKRVLKLAKLQTPVDRYDLENSIQLEEMKADGAGRASVGIFAGGTVTIAGVERDVNQYAALIHESYEAILKHGPGPGTREKMRANPGILIGSHFLTRALETERKTIGQRMSRVVSNIIAEEDMDE